MGPRGRLALMGALELECDGSPVELPMSAQRVLAFVALHRKPPARLHVAGRLWAESSEQRANASLRSALWRLNRAGGGVINGSPRGLELAPWLRIDVRLVSALAHSVLNGSGSLGEREARELCRSEDLLPDWYDDWVGMEREVFRQLRLHALERLCVRLTSEGRFSEALEAGLAALNAEPLRETAHRAMIGMHLAEGNVSEAVRQYDTCERLMSSSLGLRPSQHTLRLLEEGIRSPWAEISGRQRGRATARRASPSRYV